MGSGPAPEQAPGSLQDQPPLSVRPHLEHPGASHGQERDNVRLTFLSQDSVGDQLLALVVQGMAQRLGAAHLPPLPSARGSWHPQVLGRVVTRAWGEASVPVSLAQLALCSNQ